MMMHVQKFKKQLPKILDFGIENRFRSAKATDWHDQDLLNAFFGIEANRHQRQLLPSDWNYKVYWGRSESYGGAKIVHFHGLKPGVFIECLASMDRNSSLCNDAHAPRDLTALTNIGFQNDGGRFANETMGMYQSLVPLQPF
jgi:hypothetical protein